MENIWLNRERLKMVQSQQSSEVDVRKSDIEFNVYDLTYLKISTLNGVMRFDERWTLSP